MNKLTQIFLVLFMICLPVTLWADNDKDDDDSRYLAGAVPEVDGRVVFSREFSIPGMSQDEIYERMLKWLDGRMAQNNTYRFDANRRSRSSASSASPTSYERPARFVELQHRHVEVSNRLVAYLEAQYGDVNVAQENSIGARRIDVVARTPAGDVFYEIKTYPSLRACVREAIGQLLEYAFYPDKSNAVKLVVVAPGCEKSQEYRAVAQYMEQLRSALNIPIYLILCNNSDFSFSKEL